MDEHSDVWEHVMTVLIAIAVVCAVIAATLLLQPLLVNLTPPTIPTYIFTPTP
ncbi:MAG: hypothetical protein ACLQUY_15160 [Ktedonobacterales bacterium]